MAKTILGEERSRAEPQGFSGIDLRHVGGTRVCRNFRILPCGALEKREGISEVCRLEGRPRAVWGGIFGGRVQVISLVGNVIYGTALDGSGSTELGSVSSVDGGADFFFRSGSLYLSDGEGIYRISEDGVESVSGYVPLYGKGWEGTFGGKVYEPVNLLCDRIRINYRLDMPCNILKLGIKCSELISYKANGEFSENYTGKMRLMPDGLTVLITGTLPEVCDITLLLRLDTSEDRRAQVLSSRRTALCGRGDGRRVLLFGGEDMSRAFVSREVDLLSVAESKRWAADSDDMYFPADGTVLIGDGKERLVSAVPCSDKMILLCESSVWVCELPVGKGACVYPAESGIGCASPFGAISSGGTLYSASKDGIFKWGSIQSRLGASKCEYISEPIAELLSPEFLRCAVAYRDPIRHEVAFADGDGDEVYIYSEESGAWFVFDGISIDRMLSVCGKLYFVSGDVLYTFSDALSGTVDAEYVSGESDPGKAGGMKRIRRVICRCDDGGDELGISLHTDRRSEPLELSLKGGSDACGMSHADRRINSGRFKRMHFSISSSGEGRSRVDGISFSLFK